MNGADRTRILRGAVENAAEVSTAEVSAAVEIYSGVVHADRRTKGEQVDGDQRADDVYEVVGARCAGHAEDRCDTEEEG